MKAALCKNCFSIFCFDVQVNAFGKMSALCFSEATYIPTLLNGQARKWTRRGANYPTLFQQLSCDDKVGWCGGRRCFLPAIRKSQAEYEKMEEKASARGQGMAQKRRRGGEGFKLRRRALLSLPRRLSK